MRKEKLLATICFLSLISENEGVLAYYNDMKWTPARIIGWFTEILPIKVSIFHLVCFWLMYTCRRKLKLAVAKPMMRAIEASFIAVLFCVVYGLASGGLFKPMYTQVVAWLTGLVFALTTIAVATKPEDYHRMYSAIVYAAYWRSVMAILYFMKVRGRGPWDMPSYMTTHEDTVVFVLALIILISRAIEIRSKKTTRHLFWWLALLLTAIQVNNRRLAWASLIFALMIVYFILPSKSRRARKLNRSLLIASPFLTAYVIAGWGSDSKIFAPLKSISSMGGGKIDLSTKARDNENFGLIKMIEDSPILGTGFGHEWLEVDSRYGVPVSVFPMYHYSPHDSIFALFAFCGWAGFSTLWIVFPVAGYLNARAYRHSQDPVIRSVAVVSLANLVVFLNQAYGDMGAMGTTHLGPATILGVGFASAARLSVTSGAWSARGRRSTLTDGAPASPAGNHA